MEALVNLVVALAILLALAMVLVAACRPEETSNLPSSQDSEMIKHIYLHTMRIENLMESKAQTLAEEIVRKYKEELARAESFPIIVRLDHEAPNELLVKAADLLIKRGWLAQFESRAVHCAVAVGPVKPREHREKPRRRGVYDGVMHW